MPKRKSKPKIKKAKVIKQKQKQSIVINIDNKGRKPRPRIVRVGSSSGSLGTSTIYTYPLQQPIYNAEHNELKSITDSLTDAFKSVQNTIKVNQPLLNPSHNVKREFRSLDDIKVATTPLVPIPELKTIKIPQKIPVKSVSSNVSVASSIKTTPARVFKPIPVKPKSTVQEYFSSPLSSLPKSEFSTFPREDALSPFSTIDERKGFKPTPIPTTNLPIPTTKPPRKIITARTPRTGELVINPNTGRKIGVDSAIAKGLRASGKIK